MIIQGAEITGVLKGSHAQVVSVVIFSASEKSFPVSSAPHFPRSHLQTALPSPLRHSVKTITTINEHREKIPFNSDLV